MSSVGPSELILLFVVALLVLGPERFPKVARQVGIWVGRARRAANQLRHEFEREIALSEIAKAERRSKEWRRASPDDDEADDDRSAGDYEAGLYTTTHEGLDAERGAQPNGYDGAGRTAPERAARKNTSPEPTVAEPAADEATVRPPDSGIESEPQQPETEAQPAESEHAPVGTPAAGEEPSESADKTPSR